MTGKSLGQIKDILVNEGWEESVVNGEIGEYILKESKEISEVDNKVQIGKKNSDNDNKSSNSNEGNLQNLPLENSNAWENNNWGSKTQNYQSIFNQNQKPESPQQSAYTNSFNNLMFNTVKIKTKVARLYNIF